MFACIHERCLLILKGHVLNTHGICFLILMRHVCYFWDILANIHIKFALLELQHAICLLLNPRKYPNSHWISSVYLNLPELLEHHMATSII